MKIWCRILGHRWKPYGWTGDPMWPTKGKKCTRCGLEEPWPWFDFD